MRTAAVSVVIVVVLILVFGIALTTMNGLSARTEPSAAERVLARLARRWAIPRGAANLVNPVPFSAEAWADAHAHFADHCASCHDNDGRGKTTLGQNMYPKAPDMWDRRTQDLSDGEIFHIIKNGVRLTGMAAWGEDTPEDDRERTIPKRGSSYTSSGD